MLSRLTFVGLGLALPLATVAQFPLLDPAQGQIGGKVAMAFLAHELGDPSAYLPPEGYEVHLVAASDLDRELVYPAGKWFQPPPGRYRFWVEGHWGMSNGSAIVNYSGSPFRERGLVGVEEMHPAGRIALDPTIEAGPGVALRLLHVESHNRTKFPQREISRRVFGEARWEGVLMPVGPVLASLFDNARDEYVALSRPLRVQQGKTITVSPTPPASGGTHVVVSLNRPRPVSSHDEYDVKPFLTVADTKLEPAVTIPTADRVYAVWYQVEGRLAKLGIKSETVFLEPVEIPLRAGKIERARARLSPLPGIEVGLELPDELRRQGLRLAVRSLSKNEAVISQEVEPEAREAEFPRLPLDRYEVELLAGPWRFTEWVDLQDGQSREVLFAPEPIFLGGAVYRGEEKHPGRVAFYAGGGREHEVETGEDGRYQATVFRAVLLARVGLEGLEGPPFAEVFDPPIRSSQTLDFHVPATDFRVRVLDAQTGWEIPEAQVGARNETLDGKTFQQSATTDEEGVASLPPVRPGRLLVIAEAEGYLPMAEPRIEVVEEEDRGRELTVALEPVGGTRPLVLTHADGGPVAGAEIIAVSSLRDPGILWSGASDAQGRVAVPERVRGAFLLVRHPAAGFRVGVWQGASEEPARWTLAPGRSLTVEVVDTVGTPVPWAGLTLWVDGFRLEGAGLGWVTHSHGLTDQAGVWLGRNLPATTEALLAWRRSARDDAHSGSLDTLAVPVPRESADRLQLVAAE